MLFKDSLEKIELGLIHHGIDAVNLLPKKGIMLIPVDIFQLNSTETPFGLLC
ncbi:MAG: hypothetical protein M3162_02190 [Thermoproteota archaeon]|nr:hypothetical protein [Thermoproteota archaeon]